MRRGFTVAEVVMAAFIVVMGFIAVAKIVPSSNRTAAVNRERLLALRIARNTIDDVRSRRPFPNSTAPSYTHYDPDSASALPVPLVGEFLEGKRVGTEFFITDLNITVAAPVASGGGVSTAVGVGNITVNVTWRAGSDRSGNVDAKSRKSLVLTGGWQREP